MRLPAKPFQPLQNVFNLIIKIVGCIKFDNLNTRLFKYLCKDMNSSHEVLLFYTSEHWLSKTNVLSPVFEIKNEIKSFAETLKKRVFILF